MKLLRRNMTEFEYLPFDGSETDVNENGEHTGEFHPEYGTPVFYKGNISSPSGHTVQQFYGEEIRYTHTLLMDDPKAEINEHGMVRWNGGLYEIMAVRPSMNVLNIALRKMTSIVEEEGPTGETGSNSESEGPVGETGSTGGDGE